MSEIELSQPARRCLDAIVSEHPKNRTQIAAATGIFKSNLGRYIDELEVKGLIRAERGGGKAVLYSPTKPPDVDLLFEVFVKRERKAA